jgi:hypothetical protein
LRVVEINAGNESVPTLVFADGSTLTEPSRKALMARLESLNIGLAPLSISDRILIQLRNPIISIFGVVFTLAGWMVEALPVISLGVFLIVLPLVARIFQK